MFGEADIRAYDAERDAKLGKQPRRAKATALRKASRSRYAVDPEVIATGRLPEKAAVVLAYHVLCKPTEIFAIVSGEFNKTPAEPWRQYAWLFREYWTAVVSPELLAALAQVEGAGNPLARTYWRWQLSWNPLALYQPASSGVGMFQMTDAAFAEARQFCIRNHIVLQDDCRFGWLYIRVIPSHAIELAAIYLDRNLERILPAAQPRSRVRSTNGNWPR
jgi:hypothetical protein